MTTAVCDASANAANAGLATPPMHELRLLPAPMTEPPYDDELVAPPVDSVQAGQQKLALAFMLPGGLPAEPALRLVAPPNGTGDSFGAELSDDEDLGFPPEPTPATALPNPRPVAGRLVQAILEVVVAARPLAQLVRWTSEDVYRQLARRVRIAGHEDATVRGGLAPGRVRSIHVSEPRDNLVEVCAIVQRAGRATAVALRLEGIDGRWQCTALQFG